jgi:hypothetical protein
MIHTLAIVRNGEELFFPFDPLGQGSHCDGIFRKNPKELSRWQMGSCPNSIQEAWTIMYDFCPALILLSSGHW